MLRPLDYYGREKIKNSQKIEKEMEKLVEITLVPFKAMPVHCIEATALLFIIVNPSTDLFW